MSDGSTAWGRAAPEWPDWMRERWDGAGFSDADRLGWVRQVLRWRDLRGGRACVATQPVPERVAADGGLLARFGLERRWTGLVVARPWRPGWLAGAAGHDVDGAHAAAPRRNGEAAGGDPLLAAVGHETYRSAGQRGAMRAVLLAPAGSALLVVLPTGAGKSLLATLPPLLEDGLTVVVVPTVALALDQERAIERASEDQRGAGWGPGPFAYVGGGGAGGDGRREVIRARVRSGEQRVVFAAPESVVGGLREPLRAAAEAGVLRRLVVDEAHMVDAWGEDFRPSFQMVAGFRRALLALQPALRTVLLSATVTEGTRDTLASLFGPGLATVSGARLRPEPAYWAVEAASDAEREAYVLEAVHRLPRPLVLYTSLPEDAEAWGDRLRGAGFARVGTMTGGSTPGERERLLARWAEGSLDLVTGTSAFGMGIDQPHVRSVVHATLPESLDRYYQEVGRAGRDGGASVSLLVSTPGDRSIAESLSERTYLKPATGHARWERLFATGDTVATDGGAHGGRLVAVNVEVGRTAMMYSRTNEYWNYRTLTMMERAGLVSLQGPAPYDPEAGGRRELVAVLDSRHLDPAVWEERMSGVRRAGRRAGRAGLAAMRSLLRSSSCWAVDLQGYYALEGLPLPAPSCGGCPACRGAGEHPYALPATEPDLPWAFGVRDLAEAPVPAMLAEAGVLGVEVPAGGGLQARTRLARLLRALAARGFRMVVSPEEWVDLRRDVQPGLPPLLTAPAVTPLLPALPTIVLCPGEHVPPSAFAGGRPEPRVVVFEEGVRDPHLPHRLLRDRIETRRLDHLLSDLSA